MLERRLKSRSIDEKSKLKFVEQLFLQKRIEMNSRKKNVFLTKRFLTVLKDLFFHSNCLLTRKRSRYHNKILLKMTKDRVMKLKKSFHKNKFNMFDLQNHN